MAASGRRGARIVSISPGIIDTPDGPGQRCRSSRRCGRRWRLAARGAWPGRKSWRRWRSSWCSPAASFITGIDILADGGAAAGQAAQAEAGTALGEGRRECVMKLDPLGVWCAVDHLTSAELASFAQVVEAGGYGALWQPEMLGRDALVASSWLLANTGRLIVATGIASIYARDAQAAFSAQQGLAEQSGGRFLLGLGVSHAPMVEALRGHHYGKPVASMRAYLGGDGQGALHGRPAGRETADRAGGAGAADDRAVRRTGRRRPHLQCRPVPYRQRCAQAVGTWQAALRRAEGGAGDRSRPGTDDRTGDAAPLSPGWRTTRRTGAGRAFPRRTGQARGPIGWSTPWSSGATRRR